MINATYDKYCKIARTKISAENDFVKLINFNNKKLMIMNLDDLNLVELNAQEVQELDGGWIPIALAIIYLGGEIYKSYNGLDEYGRP